MMQKNNVVSLLWIVASAVLMFSLKFIADLMGGMGRPYVPSIIGVLVLVIAVILYFGIKKSPLNFRENAIIILIFLFTGILSAMYMNANPFNNIYSLILFAVLAVSFILSFAYIISQIADLSFKDKLAGIGDKSKFFCIGIIVVFVACVFLSNMASEHIDYATGHVELENDNVTVVEGSIENGEWVYAGSYEPTGEKGYRVTYPSLKTKLKFNINDVEWDSELKYDADSLKDMLNNGALTATIRLFNANGEVEHTYGTDAKIKGDYVIVNSTVGGDSQTYDQGEDHADIDWDYSNITYATLEVRVIHQGSHNNGDENYGVILISNRFKI